MKPSKILIEEISCFELLSKLLHNGITNVKTLNIITITKLKDGMMHILKKHIILLGKQ